MKAFTTSSNANYMLPPPSSIETKETKPPVHPMQFDKNKRLPDLPQEQPTSRSTSKSTPTLKELSEKTMDLAQGRKDVVGAPVETRIQGAIVTNYIDALPIEARLNGMPVGYRPDVAPVQGRFDGISVENRVDGDPFIKPENASAVRLRRRPRVKRVRPPLFAHAARGFAPVQAGEFVQGGNIVYKRTDYHTQFGEVVEQRVECSPSHIPYQLIKMIAPRK